MRRASGASILALALAFTFGTVGTAQAVVPIEPVLTGPSDTWLAFANDDYLVYSFWKRSAPKTYSALAEPLGGGPLTKLNRAGTRGFTGNFVPGTNRVIYWEWTRKGSNVFLYDLDTGQRSAPPGVNTKAWEWQPLVSTNYVFFARDRYRNRNWYTSLLVRRRSDGVTRTLGTWNWDPNLVFTGSVGERYATYTVCTRKNCFAYLYDWDTSTKRRIPTVNDRAQYAPVVDEVNGTVYFSRSGQKCGSSVAIWRLPLTLTGVATKIVALPRGIDTGWTSSLTANGTTGQMDLWFERWNCSQENADVVVARGVDAGPTPTGG